jgi:hypothetical protein
MSLHVEPAELTGRLARDAHGRPLGEVETVFPDADGSGSRFVGIDMADGRVVVPVDGAEVDPTVYAIDLPYMVDRINGAPTISPETEELDPETERRVVEHFGVGAHAAEGGGSAEAEHGPEATSRSSRSARRSFSARSSSWWRPSASPLSTCACARRSSRRR